MLTNKEDAYILGLWCADGYHRSSSIGLSNTDVGLIRRFSKHLLKKFPKERLRLRSYIPVSLEKSKIDNFGIVDKVSCCSVRKAKQISYHLYVNSRPLLREFRENRNNLANMESEFVIPYIAGRFDGDGSVGKDIKRDFRITYTSKPEAETDKSLLERIRPYQLKVYRYQKANVYVLYCSRIDSSKLAKDLFLYSIKLQRLFDLPRRD
jgi:hypothetical protein